MVETASRRENLAVVTNVSWCCLSLDFCHGFCLLQGLSHPRDFPSEALHFPPHLLECLYGTGIGQAVIRKQGMVQMRVRQQREITRGRRRPNGRPREGGGKGIRGEIKRDFLCMNKHE